MVNYIVSLFTTLVLLVIPIYPRATNAFPFVAKMINGNEGLYKYMNGPLSSDDGKKLVTLVEITTTIHNSSPKKNHQKDDNSSIDVCTQLDLQS